MPQEQRSIDLIMLSGEIKVAIATGNNAAWICCCKYDHPLIGRTGPLIGPSTKTNVICPKCSRVYYVFTEDKDRGRAIRVDEV